MWGSALKKGPQCYLEKQDSALSSKRSTRDLVSLVPLAWPASPSVEVVLLELVDFDLLLFGKEIIELVALFWEGRTSMSNQPILLKVRLLMSCQT